MGSAIAGADSARREPGDQNAEWPGFVFGSRWEDQRARYKRAGVDVELHGRSGGHLAEWSDLDFGKERKVEAAHGKRADQRGATESKLDRRRACGGRGERTCFAERANGVEHELSSGIDRPLTDYLQRERLQVGAQDVRR